MPGPSPRFFWIVGLLAVAACAAYAAAVLAGADLAEVLALDGIAAEHEHWHIQPLTAAGFQGVKLALSLVAAGLGIAGGGLAWSATGRRELAALAPEIRQGWNSITHRWQLLPQRARLGAWLGLAVLTALRTYFSLSKPLHPEEIASYEYFVSKGLLAVSSYYPIPNNHILSNTISWAFYRLKPGFWWSMRLPVLLVSTAGTAGLFAGLLCWANFRVAFWATAGFCWLQLSLYNASAGRGYWLLISLVGILFFCTLVLDQPGGPRRAAWVGLVLASLAGFYTIPTFAYALASALAWLGGRSLYRRHWPQLGILLAMSAAIATGVAALYAPLVLISGAGALFGNGFVTAQPAAVFWLGLPAYLWFTEGLLAGQRTVGGLLVLAAIAGTGYWLWRARRHHFASPEPLHLGSATLWFALFPYALVLVQRVFAPERVLLYKSFFLFTLLALLADAWLRRPAPAWLRRWSGRALVAAFAVFAAYQTYYVEFLNRQIRTTTAAYRAGFEWLRRQPAGPVLAPEPLHELFFRFYAHTTAPDRPWQIDMVRRPTRRYAYVVAFPNKRGAFQPVFAFPPAFANSQVEIFAVPRP
ncbi:hypothetical protein [Hymenobacter terricola]|uniref:hypothetical protein n=1 Tax=Hymenobacter terricola TaxID=2819236 RepID=UPI001B310815|nr:hypothetical protein [Hymenobacter terricola]